MRPAGMPRRSLRPWELWRLPRGGQGRRASGKAVGRRAGRRLGRSGDVVVARTMELLCPGASPATARFRPGSWRRAAADRGSLHCADMSGPPGRRAVLGTAAGADRWPSCGHDRSRPTSRPVLRLPAPRAGARTEPRLPACDHRAARSVVGSLPGGSAERPACPVNDPHRPGRCARCPRAPAMLLGSVPGTWVELFPAFAHRRAQVSGSPGVRRPGVWVCRCAGVQVSGCACLGASSSVANGAARGRRPGPPRDGIGDHCAGRGGGRICSEQMRGARPAGCLSGRCC